MMMTAVWAIWGVALAQEAPADRLRAAIEGARKAESFTYRFDVKVQIPHSDPAQYNGSGIVLKDRTFFQQIRGSGGTNHKIVGNASRVLIYHQFVDDWTPSEEFGDLNAGRGFKNAHDLMDVIAERAADAADVEDGKIRLRFEGAAAVQVLEKLRFDVGGIAPAGTWIQLTVAAADGRLKSVACAAHIARGGGGGLPDEADCQASVEVEAYERDRLPDWGGIDSSKPLQMLKKK
jgi:hypothetical protein